MMPVAKPIGRKSKKFSMFGGLVFIRWYSRESWIAQWRGAHFASWFSSRNKISRDARFKLIAGKLRVEWY